MSLKPEAYYRSVADATLARHGVTEPPVPVDALVTGFGIPIRYVSLPDFFTAATVYVDGLPVMIANAAKPEPELRRALAHMLSHVLLVMEGDYSFPRSAKDHSEADVVATELMMPAHIVIEQARLWFNDHRYLARLFGVSEREMVDRMRELGLMKGPQGVMWDY